MNIKKGGVTWFGIPLGVLLSLLMSCAPASTAEIINPVDIKEWKVPYGGRPRDPFAAGRDAIWFVGQGGHYLARFTPSAGSFFKRGLADSPGPHNLIVGSDGIVWYAGNRKGYIGRYDPVSGKIEKHAMPRP